MIYYEIFKMLGDIGLADSTYGGYLCDIVATCICLAVVLFPILIALMIMKRMLNGWR